MNPLPFTSEQLKNIDRIALVNALTVSDQYVRFLVAHLPEWRPYFQKNAGILSEKEKTLKNGLDDESLAVINRTIVSYRMILMMEEATEKRLDRYDLLVDANYFLTEREIKLKQAMETRTPLLYEEEGMEYTGYERFEYPENLKETLEMSQLRLCFGLKYLKPELIDLRGKDVIDGGAYIGDSALVFNDYLPKKVYAFEPSPVSFRSLLEVIRLNRCEDRIAAVQTALGKQSGVFPFYTKLEPDAGAGLRFRETKEKIEVPCTTIDDFVRKNDLQPGLIKLDTEGGEFDALLGAVETLKKFKPILLLAVNHRAVDFFEIKPFLENLNPGYRFLLRDTSFVNPNGEISLIAWCE